MTDDSMADFSRVEEQKQDLKASKRMGTIKEEIDAESRTTEKTPQVKPPVI